MRTGRQLIIASWGIAGVIAVIGRALVALTPIAIEPIRAGQLGSWHWVVLLIWVGTNAYAEGVVGFHRKFSPRTVDRALYLGRNPTWARVLLAPAFCIGLFQATRRVRIVSRSMVVGIVLLVVTVRQLAQPWRGIIDAGVVVGLALGLLSLIYLFVRAVVTKREPVLQQVEP
ncbi:MAG: hypothetical protein BMS9Abin37_3310 [Acidobacteriota bacterium]|nr:MAG: hypothetical protein BMS9Abin37_3310 [Acidobacteriota bacterium]